MSNSDKVEIYSACISNNSIVVTEHTLWDSNLLKFIETHLMAHVWSVFVSVIYVLEKNMHSVVAGYILLKRQLSQGG